MFAVDAASPVPLISLDLICATADRLDRGRTYYVGYSQSLESLATTVQAMAPI